MIQQKEINAHAGKYMVRDAQIEKDYILTWVLYGISTNEILSKALAFKGGTVLKKMYFEKYRFSEDLDFTLMNDSLTIEEIKTGFVKVFDFLKDVANITCQINENESGTHEKGNIYFYINYIGPLNASLESRDLKVDITRGEVLEFATVSKKAFITYSDLPEGSFEINCYTLEEVLIEKMVALMGRQEPRDLYDFWHLTEIEGMTPKKVKGEFERKAKNKGQNPEKFQEKVINKEFNLKKDWERKLVNQINDLPKFDDVFRESKRHFKF